MFTFVYFTGSWLSVKVQLAAAGLSHMTNVVGSHMLSLPPIHPKCDVARAGTKIIQGGAEQAAGTQSWVPWIVGGGLMLLPAVFIFAKLRSKLIGGLVGVAALAIMAMPLYQTFGAVSPNIPTC